MKSTAELMAIAKARNGGCTDYRLSKLLGVTTGAVAHYSHGRSLPATPIAARLGELCGLDPEAVVCWVNIERCSSETERKVWRSILQRVEASERLPLAA